MENRKIFYNTHPAIISLEVFDKVQEIRQQRHRRTATGKSNMFSGLVFCNDCKQKLYYSTTSYFEKRQDFFICSTPVSYTHLDVPDLCQQSGQQCAGSGPGPLPPQAGAHHLSLIHI